VAKRRVMPMRDLDEPCILCAEVLTGVILGEHIVVGGGVGQRFAKF